MVFKCGYSEMRGNVTIWVELQREEGYDPKKVSEQAEQIVKERFEQREKEHVY
jgi:hypothetical protein